MWLELSSQFSAICTGTDALNILNQKTVPGILGQTLSPESLCGGTLVWEYNGQTRCLTALPWKAFRAAAVGPSWGESAASTEPSRPSKFLRRPPLNICSLTADVARGRMCRTWSRQIWVRILDLPLPSCEVIQPPASVNGLNNNHYAHCAPVPGIH